MDRREMDTTNKDWVEFIGNCIGTPGEPEFVHLCGDGSTRRFYRVIGAERPAVLMVNTRPPRHLIRNVDENETWVYLAGLFSEILRGPPEVYGFDRERGLILVEDLGDRLLQAEVLERGAESDWTRRTYERLIEMLVRLQVEGIRRLEVGRIFNRRYNDVFMYRWEGLYFAEHFLGRLCGLDSDPLKPDLESLAGAAGASFSRDVLIYRDFQSRNIMLGPGDSLRLVDFQGARPGPPAYDPASLLHDPYVQLPDRLREELAGYYRTELALLDPVAADEFPAQFPLIAAHRLMQALAAYAKLSLTDGKREFLRYVPRGLSELKKMLEREEFRPFATLRETVRALDPALTDK